MKVLQIYSVEHKLNYPPENDRSFLKAKRYINFSLSGNYLSLTRFITHAFFQQKMIQKLFAYFSQ